MKKQNLSGINQHGTHITEKNVKQYKTVTSKTREMQQKRHLTVRGD